MIHTCEQCGGLWADQPGESYSGTPCKCQHEANNAFPPPDGGIATATETVGSTDLLDALNERHYNYSDMLEAYKTGRYHELKYASSDRDQEDFIMWLKRHCASNEKAHPPLPAQPRSRKET